MRMIVLLGLVSLALFYGAFGAGALMSKAEDRRPTLFQSILAPQFSVAPAQAPRAQRAPVANAHHAAATRAWDVDAQI